MSIPETLQPRLLFLACALFFAFENIIIDRKYGGMSPLGTQPVYAVCYFIICAAVWPLRRQFGLEIKSSPIEIMPWVIAGGLIFTVGAFFLFKAYAKGFEVYSPGGAAQVAMTTLTVLPVLIALINCAIDRKPPSIRVVASCVLAISAVMLLSSDLPDQQTSPEAPPQSPR